MKDDNMVEVQVEEEEKILYDLLTLVEWPQTLDYGLQKVQNNSTSSVSYFKPWRMFTKFNPDSKKFLQTEFAWQLAVSQDGKVVGVLQESLLEIRTARDEYSTVVGKALVPQDQCPQLRKLAWSPDNTFLAVARDNGVVHVYNLLGCNIATIQPSNFSSSNDKSSYDIQPVTGLLFLQPKFKSTKWSNELFVIYHNGIVRSILLSSLDGCDYEENVNYSLENYFPQGITSVAYHSSHQIIIIAGPCNSKEHGLSIWRVLNDYPYLKAASGFEKNIQNKSSFLRFLPGYSTQLNSNTVVKMKISHNGEKLACLHLSGEISLWHLPGIRLYKRWPLLQQPGYGKVNPRNSGIKKSSDYFGPVDISWWSDTALAIARRSGDITVCSSSTLNNLLGESPEFLYFSPQISSIHGSRTAVIALECETENNYGNNVEDSQDGESDNETSILQASIQAALYSVTDMDRFEPKRKTPRITQRVYRLLALKRTSPEELYMRKIEHEDYDSALLLAQTYNLDCDLVYQKQWRSNNVTKESIYSFLDKIKNTCWVINECLQRVPDTINSAIELLQFGLKKTSLKTDLMSGTLDSEQKKIISCRRHILSLLDNLTIYQKIIDGPAKYSATDYDQFRRKSSIVNIVDFAHEENWRAVSIMFTYKGKELLRHRLPILSHFPETFPPLHYRSLLPEIVNDTVLDWEVKEIRSPDWSEDEKFKDCASGSDTSSYYIYDCDPSLQRFKAISLTPPMVEDWYIYRSREIEKNTGLVDLALSFASLGKERNVKNLDGLLFNLLTLHSLVYIIEDQDITLSKLEELSHLEQAKLLLSKTTKSTFVKDMLNLIHPFAVRCEQEGRCSIYSLLRGLLSSISERDLTFTVEFFKYVKEESNHTPILSLAETMSIALDCLYACRETDQLDNSYLILECLPVRGESMSTEEESLHDEIDRLENHLEVCDILNRYNIKKSLLYILENEDNQLTGKQLMQDMAKFTKEEICNFDELLNDLERIQSLAFTSIPASYCVELVALTQLISDTEEVILSAEVFLQCNADQQDKIIPLNKSIDLVVEASRVHFERARNFDDDCIRLAQRCLNLITEPSELICEELDLIRSLRLLEDFDVNLLPIQVRKCTDKMQLIEMCLKAKPNAYMSHNGLLQLAHTLRIYGDDKNKRNGEVLMLIAQYALDSSDYAHCSEICERLVSQNFHIAWSVVRALASCDDYRDIASRKEFFAFAILNCPVENLEELIQSRVDLNTNIFPEMNSEKTLCVASVKN